MTDAVQIVLAKRPEGDVTADCFREETVTLPGLTDGFSGSAPDLGAVELGQDLPHYGPRK